MADEENPLGGGPFGVGPFGPLVATAAAAATAFSMVVVTTSVPAPRTLFYQANIKPPVVQPAVDNINAVASTTTGAASTKSLFYQARIKPPVQLAVDNTGTLATWHVQLSRAAARPPVEPTRYTPFVPGVAPQVTADKWLQPFKRQVAALLPYHTQPTLPYTPIAVVAEVTADQWLPRWRGPPSYLPAPAGGSPFVPKEAVLDNTVTPDAWLPRWQGPPSYHPAPAGGSPFVPKEAVRENTVTPDAWLPRWQGPPRYLQQLAAGVVYPPQGAVAVNTRTEWDWQIRWQGPPSYHPAPAGGSPFVPREAVLENTQTPDKWLRPLGTVPPRYVPPKILAQPFVPREAVLDNTVTPDKWLIKWQGPPNYNPAPAGGSPFIPKEAVLENTVTPDKWLVRFAQAVPVPKPVPTQPVLGYPYTSQAIVVPYEQWWHQPLSRPANRPPVSVTRLTVPPYPYVDAVVVNVTPDKWLLPFGRAKARPPARDTNTYLPTYTAIPLPYFSVQHTTVTFSRVLYAKTTFEGREPPPVVVAAVTVDQWHRPFVKATARAFIRNTNTYLPTYAAVVQPVAFSAASTTTGARRSKNLYYQARIGMEWAAPPPVPVADLDPACRVYEVLEFSGIIQSEGDQDVEVVGTSDLVVDADHETLTPEPDDDLEVEC